MNEVPSYRKWLSKLLCKLQSTNFKRMVAVQFELRPYLQGIPYWGAALLVGALVLSAAIVAGLVAQWLSGRYLYFGYPAIGDVRVSSVGWAILVGILCGILALPFHRLRCGYYASHRDETYGTSHEAAQEAARRNKKDGAAWDKRDKASVKVIWDNLIGVSVFCEDQTEESRFDPFGGK